jgi:hypothetical protein
MGLVAAGAFCRSRVLSLWSPPLLGPIWAAALVIPNAITAATASKLLGVLMVFPRLLNSPTNNGASQGKFLLFRQVSWHAWSCRLQPRQTRAARSPGVKEDLGTPSSTARSLSSRLACRATGVEGNSRSNWRENKVLARLSLLVSMRAFGQCLINRPRLSCQASCRHNRPLPDQGPGAEEGNWTLDDRFPDRIAARIGLRLRDRYADRRSSWNRSRSAALRPGRSGFALRSSARPGLQCHRRVTLNRGGARRR